MRTLAIGDIHGCFRALTTLERFVGLCPDDHVITLGDHVNRGPDSCRVVQWLIDRAPRGWVALRGNHEIRMLAARGSVDRRADWLRAGGRAVLQSYGIDHPDHIPAAHWQFLATGLSDYHITAHPIFVTADVEPAAALGDQTERTLCWQRLGNPLPHRSGRTMICGHTAQRNHLPLDLGHAICIDTAACKGGWLTCLDVDRRFCWQSNEAGQTRCFPLGRLTGRRGRR